MTGHRRLLAGLVGTNAAAYIGTSVPISLLLVTHLTTIAGAEATSAFSLVTGIGGLTGLLANPLGGRISDRTAARFGRRRTWILTAGLGAAILLVVMGWTTEVWQVALGWALITALIAFQLAASSALAADQVAPARRGTVSGVVAFVALAGPVLGFALVSAVPALPWLQWGVVGALSAAGVFLCVMLVRDPQHPAPEGELGLAMVLRAYWVNPRKHPAFGWAWVVRFLITAAWASNSYLAFVFTQRFEVSTDAVAGKILVLTLIGILCVAVTAWLTGWLSDRIQRQKPFVLGGGLVLAVGLVVVAFSPAIPAVYAGAAIMSLGYGTFLATDFALCLRMLPDPESAGKDFAVLNIASILPVAAVPFVAPALLAHGGFVMLFGGLAVLGAVGAVCVLRLPDIGEEGQPRFAAMTRRREETPLPSIANI
ncbi:Na+/melibiose symporter [Amycolatopsis xylanica]|uniref:Na+/melibiose symporter n=1 Tax=Amycolatopsis xylanica TaxID=589385 RepID=A0A1H2W5T5_9PSEU|nr:MFS transporter [Amycolatopsis xylanica]SDW75449.1 Na+/melibiose symporter [Amycolatopsis xylanica]